MPATVQEATGVKPVPRERVELILSRLDQLPTVPVVAARLLALTSSNESCARDVVELIQADAALTAQVLRLVNRADYGVHGEVTSVIRTVTLLGFDTVRNAVLSSAFLGAFPTTADQSSRTSLRQEMWRHNLAVGCMADMIAVQVGQHALRGEAFIGGLLHDIGKLALEACLPKSYARVAKLVHDKGVCVTEAEREVLGLDHTVAGRHLAARWKLPSSIQAVAWLHHQAGDALPSSIGWGNLIRIVRLADHLVRQQGIGFSGYRHDGDISAPASEVGLDTQKMDQLIQRLPEHLEPWFDLFRLDQQQNPKQSLTHLAKVNERLSSLNQTMLRANHQLKRKSDCLDAVNAFTQAASEFGGVNDICLALAGSFRSWIDADHAAAYVFNENGHILHVGWINRAGDPRASVYTRADDFDPEIWRTLGSMPQQGPLIEAPDACHVLWKDVSETTPSETIWAMPFSCDSGCYGAVLFPAPGATREGWWRSTGVFDSLISTARMAIDSAQSRQAAQRVSEELLNLNRRLHAIQQDAVRMRSMSMIATMAAGAAHELNNPLSVISGRAQMEMKECPSGSMGETLKIIVDQAQRATRIVSDLMGFAKPEPPRVQPIDLMATLESLCQHWREAAGLSPQQIRITLTDEKIRVNADPEQFREILDAIISNAIDATHRKTARLQINSSSRASDETIRIVVEDNGTGMTSEVLEHALDPFFSSRPAGRGRGLGLSRAYRFAEINGGRLTIRSKPNAGTTVMVELLSARTTE